VGPARPDRRQPGEVGRRNWTGRREPSPGQIESSNEKSHNSVLLPHPQSSTPNRVDYPDFLPLGDHQLLSQTRCQSLIGMGHSVALDHDEVQPGRVLFRQSSDLLDRCRETLLWEPTTSPVDLVQMLTEREREQARQGKEFSEPVDLPRRLAGVVEGGAHGHPGCGAVAPVARLENGPTGETGHRPATKSLTWQRHARLGGYLISLCFRR
jgi:hypothetical protein